MTPEEHFDQAERAAQSFADSHDEVDARWAEVCTSLGRALSEHEARRHAAGGPARPGQSALRNDVSKLKGQLEKKDRDLAILQEGYDGVGKAWTERGGLILKLEQQVKDLRAKLGAYATNELVLETRERQLVEADVEIKGLRAQVKKLGDKLYDANEFRAQCEQLAKENDRLATEIKSRDASITQLLIKLETADLLARNLRSEIKSWQEISDKNAKLYSSDQPTPLTDGLPDVPEGYCRMVIDAPVDTVYECAGFSPIKIRLVDSEGAPAKLFHRRSFGRKTDYPEAAAKAPLGPETVTVDFGGTGPHSKARRVYGALRAAEQVWRTPETTRWRGLRGRWAVEGDVPSDVTAVFTRSVDYPDTDAVGVDLVTWPDGVDPSRRSHDTLEILNRQRMSRKAWATHPDNIGDMEHP